MPRRPPAAAADGPGERFATHVGVRVDRSGGPSHYGCGATATLTATPPWRSRDDPPVGDDGTVPTGALLALVDATARAAAEVAVARPGHRASLAPTAAAVQFGSDAAGSVTATATVPCEGMITDRADDQGSFRFSVAVEVNDDDHHRVATATVQWLAHLEPDPDPDPARDGT